MFDTLFWALYGIDVLTKLAALAYGLFAAACVTSVIALFICSIAAEGKGDDLKYNLGFVFKPAKWVLIPIVLFFLLSFAIPQKDTMYMMLGVRATDNLVNSETGQRVQKLVNKKLDEYLGTLEEKVKK
jgi:hypothetical protein